MKAYDLLVQAESGLAAITGRPEGPGRVGRFGLRYRLPACMPMQAVLEALAAPAGVSGEGAGPLGLALRWYGGLDDRAAAASGLWTAGAPRAGRPQPSEHRALTVSMPRPSGEDDRHLRSRTSGSGGGFVERGAETASRSWTMTRACTTTPPGSRTGRIWTT